MPIVGNLFGIFVASIAGRKMKTRIKLILLWGILSTSFTLNAQDIWNNFEHLFSPVRHYIIYQTISEINIDGKQKESSWQNAEWSDLFRDIEGDKKPEPLYKTRFKMLWDNNNLYILAELEEPHVWAYYDKHDMIVFHENDFEVFIDPDRDTYNYFEFEVNAQNILFDLFLPKPYRNGGKPNIEWNAKGFKSAVNIEGTINDPSDKDKKWMVEMAIPFSSLSVDGRFLVPQDGNSWKINFSRVQWQTEIVHGKYTRKRDKVTNKNMPEDNWVWSPQGVINMHYPERWGIVQFSANPVNGNKADFQMPIEEKLNKYLWLIYYKQQHFRREYGVYSGTLSKLDIPEGHKTENISFQLRLETDVHKFIASLVADNGLEISIDQSGFFQVIKEIKNE
jgi:hypothetical protein